ncbi:hypothetical protein J6590_009325 [Homalodisca vitripennis]|nr:hypothetical protein J6590_009325 [Homalodisca vitripennis]
MESFVGVHRNVKTEVKQREEFFEEVAASVSSGHSRCNQTPSETPVTSPQCRSNVKWTNGRCQTGLFYLTPKISAT